MRKTNLCLKMAALFCIFALTGCQKAPELAEDDHIMHARGDMERQVQDITAAGEQEQTQEGGGTAAAGRYQGTVGTGDNIIYIDAELPVMPDNLYIITLKPDEGLDEETLRVFLDSEGGSIEDTSQELLKEIEDSDGYNSTMNEGERFLYSKFGDHSAARLGDGKKEASFTYHTGAYYVDHALLDQCHRLYGGDYSETLITGEQMSEGGFSAQMAEEILLDKVKAVGVSGIVLKRIYCITDGGDCFYQMEFVPAYDGITVDIGSDAYALGQVYPNGYALVSEEGVAEVSLTDFCGKEADKESVTAIPFEKVLKILEQYLDNGMIESDGKITYDRVELIYYPVPNPAPAPDEIEYQPELVLTPIWHIYMPIDEYVDGGYGMAAEPSHICVNAVTGELILGE